MKICIVGPAYPYRGGLASIMETMARVYQAQGHDVQIYTFTVQYPSLLFPGKTQYVTTPPPADLRIERVLNNVNPLSWVKLGLRIRREAPDIVLMKYWTPFMAPSFGTVARIARISVREHLGLCKEKRNRACRHKARLSRLLDSALREFRDLRRPRS